MGPRYVGGSEAWPITPCQGEYHSNYVREKGHRVSGTISMTNVWIFVNRVERGQYVVLGFADRKLDCTEIHKFHFAHNRSLIIVREIQLYFMNMCSNQDFAHGL